MIKIKEQTGGEMKCREHGQSMDYWCTKEGELVTSSLTSQDFFLTPGVL